MIGRATMYAFLDTETTGFAHGGVQPRIVSIAWLIADDPDSVQVFKSILVRPDGFEIPWQATAVHGITTRQARAEGKPIRTVLADFANDLTNAQPAAIVAHNKSYDLPIIEAEFGLLGLHNPCVRFETICTMLLARSRWPGQSAKLGDVYSRIFGEVMSDAHNARADVWACSRIFFQLEPR